MFILWKQYGKLIDNVYILGQVYLSLAQTIYLLYKQGSNIRDSLLRFPQDILY